MANNSNDCHKQLKSHPKTNKKQQQASCLGRGSGVFVVVVGDGLFVYLFWFVVVQICTLNLL